MSDFPIKSTPYSDAKATQLAAQKLLKLQTWNEAQTQRQKLRHQRFEQFKGLLFWVGGWIGSGRSGTLFFLTAIFTFSTLGLIAGLNWPTTIACKSDSEGCYLLRLDKKTVILPQQFQNILAEYERNKNKSKRRK